MSKTIDKSLNLTLTDEFDGLDFSPVPVGPMLSPEIYEKEREKIFRRSWLMVGRVEEIPKPGDFFVKDLAVVNASVLVVRGKNSEIRAFHNVCRHRGSRLAADSGSRKFFSCPLHGWTYDTDGRLVSVTQKETFPGLDKEQNSLVPIHLDIWVGKIFVNLLDEPRENLAAFLGGIKEHLDPYPFDELELVGKYTQVLDANWKLVMHNTQEIYHVEALHTRTIPGGFTTIDKVRFYGPHQIGSCAGDADYKPTPAENLAHRFGRSDSEGGAALSRGMRRDAAMGLNLDGLQNFVFDFATIFPNHIMTIGDGWVFAYNYWPLAVDKTLLEIKRYYRRPKTPSEVIGREFALMVMREADCEDGMSIEQSQAGLGTGAIKNVHMGDQEILCRHLHKVVENWLTED